MGDNIYRRYKALWHSMYENLDDQEFYSEFLKSQLPLINSINDSNIFISIFNQQELKSEFVTDNIQDVLGYSKEIAYTKGYNHFLNNIEQKHQDYIVIGTTFFGEILSSLKNPNWAHFKVNVMGIRYNHPQKGEIKLYLQQYFLSMYETDFKTKYSLNIIQDVTHLLKDDFYWFRITTIDNKLQKAYHSELKNNIKSDILTSREKEILGLILEGKDTKEIASSLYISTITVNNHRQNMLDKIGAKDTTALIIIAKMCQLLA